MTTRRKFLKFALASGAAGAVPEAIARAAAIAPHPGTTFLDAEHVVILMQENRSFDHVFGTLRGVRGFRDPRAVTLANHNPVFLQSGSDGKTYMPWRLDIHETRITWMGSVPHSRDSQVDAWNGGGHDRWIDAKRSHHKGYGDIPITMGHYTRQDVPFYYALADAFTVCDQHYCGAMTSTTPNRLIFWTGTVRNRQSTDSSVYMRNPEILEGGMTWTTFPERLEKIGVSWKFYQNELSQTGGMDHDERAWLSNFGCNVLECFDRFQVGANPGFEPWLDERIAECTRHLERLQKLEMLVSEERAQQVQEASVLLGVLQKRKKNAVTTFSKLTEKEKTLFQKAFVTNREDPGYRRLEKISYAENGKTRTMKAPKSDILYQFRQDVKQGNLPTVSWLAAPEHFSDHPTSAWFGAYYVSEVMNILTENPEVWKKTVFILTYDENDGYFDHGVSYVAPDPRRPETGRVSAGITDAALEYTDARDEMALGVPENLARSGPIGLGFRVPMVIASPWSRGGWVNSQLFDHSSTLRFLEQFIEGKFGKPVRETNISSWRRAISGDLTSCFRAYDPAVTELPFLERDRFLVTIQSAKDKPLPTGFADISVAEQESIRTKPDVLKQHLWQEPGTRPACALPYELSCEARIVEGRIVIGLAAARGRHGRRSAGAPFNIYTRNLTSGQAMQAGTYAVAPGETLDAGFALSDFAAGVYDIEIHAPNGFYRHFAGRADGANLDVKTSVRVLSPRRAALVVRIANTGKTARDVSCVIMPERHDVTVRIGGGKTHETEIPLDRNAMWYDVKITEVQEPKNLWHYAGRVETGQPTTTDPQMA